MSVKLTNIKPNFKEQFNKVISTINNIGEILETPIPSIVKDCWGGYYFDNSNEFPIYSNGSTGRTGIRWDDPGEEDYTIYEDDNIYGPDYDYS